MPRDTEDNGNIYQWINIFTFVQILTMEYYTASRNQWTSYRHQHVCPQNYGVKQKKHVTEDCIYYSTYKMFRRTKINTILFWNTTWKWQKLWRKAREEFVRMEFSKRILECDNALLLGLGSGIWMFGLLLSLNCRYTFSKIILYAYYISQF